MTRLLVSVRNADEALAAVKGGADIIDVKEPHHGSLGCATPRTIREIAEALRNSPKISGAGFQPAIGIAGRLETCPTVIDSRQIPISQDSPPLSLALGELYEWKKQRAQLQHAILDAAPQFLKLGLAACGTSWRSDWLQVRSSMSGMITWVAVVYADHQQAHSPPVEEILSAAIETNCGILLLDTHTKNGTSLLDHMSFDDLKTIRSSTTQHGLLLALAGQVSLANLPQILEINPDIIAVRGAVCEQSDRTSTISSTRILDFRAAMAR